MYLMFSTVSSGMGATVCTAGRFLLVAPLTKLDEEAVEEAASVAPVGRMDKRVQQWTKPKWRIKNICFSFLNSSTVKYITIESIGIFMLYNT